MNQLQDEKHTMLSTTLAVLTLGFAGLAYYLYEPGLPKDLDQKGIVYGIVVFKKMLFLLEWTGPLFFGYTHQFQFTRALSPLMCTVPALDSDPELQVTNEVFNGVQVRVFRPMSTPEPAPVLMYFHGGGWAVGNIDGDDSLCRYLAKQTGAAVVSVEYRLAPEHPFPAGLDDCAAATAHVLKRGREQGLDSSKVGVMGTSAGGNLAAAVSLRMQDPEFSSLPRLQYQVLMVGCLQGVDLTLPAYTDNDPLLGGLLSRHDMAAYYAAYAGLDISPSTVQQIASGQHIRQKTRSQFAKYVHRDLLTKADSTSTSSENSGAVNKTLALLAEPVLMNHLLSPLLAADNVLKRVPQALVVIAQYDVLRDDSVLYVKRLRQVGVEVTSHLLKNGHHASMMGWNSETSAEAYEKIFKFIKEIIS